MRNIITIFQIITVISGLYGFFWVLFFFIDLSLGFSLYDFWWIVPTTLILLFCEVLIVIVLVGFLEYLKK